MELTTFDAIKPHIYKPITLALDGELLKATLTDVRGEGTSDVSLSCRFESPRYSYLAARLGSKIALTVGDVHVDARLFAVHPASTHIVQLTVRVQ